MSEKTNVEIANAKHHASDPNQIEAIDSFRGIQSNLANAYRYINRLGLKGGENTVSRDAGAAMWYCYDVLAWFHEQNDGDFVMDVEFYSEFDVKRYYKALWTYARECETDFELVFARDGRKRTVLAALHRAINKDKALAEIGCSEEAYREHVREMFIAAVIAIAYASDERKYDAYLASLHPNAKRASREHALHNSPPPRVRDVYKDTRSFKPDEATVSKVDTMFDMLTKAGIHHFAGECEWDEAPWGLSEI
jgi:hypothetical protein